MTACLVSLICADLASADDVRLIWDPVGDSRVALYEVHVGRSSRNYFRSVSTTANEVVVKDLAAGETYFVAVRACTANRSVCSANSNEVRFTLAATPPLSAPAPSAAFIANRTGGMVPLTVLFTDQSSGSITRRAWSLGDGTTSSAVDVVHTYTTPGTYSVQLEVEGLGGKDRELKTNWIDALPARVSASDDTGSDAIDGIGIQPLELLVEDFTDSGLRGWSVVDEGTLEGGSDWRVEAGELAQLSNIHSPPPHQPNLSLYGTYVLYEQGYGWNDYRVSYTQHAGDDDAAGLMFRVADSGNYYRFSWDRQRGYRRLTKAVDGRFTVLAADNVVFEQDRDYQIQILAWGEQLEVWIDGARVFQVSDGAHPSGSIAFYTWGMEGAYFDDLLVEDLRDLLAEDFTDFDLRGWSLIDEGT
ncbi:MAG: PKD domain-containing protein, partial [Thiohalocapsa sp.]